MQSFRTINNFLILAVFLVAILIPSTQFAADVIEIKANAFHPVGHRLTEDAFYLYGNEIAKRTNGKVNFKWFLGASLVPQFKTYDGLKSGLCDWAYFITALNPNEFVLTNALNLPFAAQDSSHASAILSKMFQEFPQMKEEYTKVMPLFFYSTAAIHVHTKDLAPKTLGELKGLRIGSPGPIVIQYLNMLGVAGQHLDQADLYTALQRNMVVGVAYPEAPLRSQKLIDLVSHHTMMSIGVDVFATAMNLNTWNKLPADVQKVFLDISESAGALFSATITNESAWVIEELKGRGDEFYYLPQSEKEIMKEKLQPVFTEWTAKIEKRGMDGPKTLKRISEISAAALKNPYKPDSWWGRAGRK